MKISIIIPTVRYEGLDITLSGLGRQTFDNNDWEIIVIDDFIDNRKDEWLLCAKKYNIKNFLYLRSKPSYWRCNRSIANARNTGLIHAKGELIIFIDDYTWIPPRLLEEHWNIYNEGYCMVGKTNVVIYAPNALNDIDKLPQPIIDKNYQLDAHDGCSHYMINIANFNVADTRGIQDVKNCSGEWFYTSNASAPLNKIISVNGFDEEFDLTREEDIGLGLLLEKAGCKFYYRTCTDCIAYHMNHMPVEEIMKNKGLKNLKYKIVAYDELRGRKTIESNPDEIQLVLKEKYGTVYDGAWGLHEERKKRDIPYANTVNGTKIFDLRYEREKIGNWI